MIAEPGGGREFPLVAIVSSVPLLSEALAEAMEGIAEVRAFPAGKGDTEGLLASLEPDAVVVDSAEEATAAATFACVQGRPLVRVALREDKLLAFEDGRWREPDVYGASPEAVRNLIVAGLFGRASAGVSGT
jgi:hypothetical protein